MKRFLLVLTAVFFTTSQSAEISPKGTRDNGVVIGIVGGLKDGDDSKFASSIQKAKSLGIHISAVSLDSPGGLVIVGASIAKLVRSNGFNTLVPSDATCASACFMIFAAGKERFAGDKARIGVHSANNPKLGETDDAKSSTIDMARFLAELGVPPPILGKLVTARPADMAWLTPDDLRLMKTNIATPPPTRESYVERVVPTIVKPTAATPEELRKAKLLMSQGLSHINADDAQSAITVLRQAVRLSPYDPDIASTYGHALHLIGKNEEAKEALLLALQIKPDFAQTYLFFKIIEFPDIELLS
jgi:hypothetical protein